MVRRFVPIGEFWNNGMEVCTMLGRVYEGLYQGGLGMEVCTMLGSFGILVRKFVPC